jgi:hypothetical protein
MTLFLSVTTVITSNSIEWNLFLNYFVIKVFFWHFWWCRAILVQNLHSIYST